MRHPLTIKATQEMQGMGNASGNARQGWKVFFLVVLLLLSSLPTLQARQRVFVVRNDVWQLVKGMTLPGEQEKAVFQFAAALQTVLDIPLEDAPSRNGVRDEIARAIQCISLRFPPGVERQKLCTAIEGTTFNTKKRARIYGIYNDALSGTTSRLPSGNTCWAEEKMLIERRGEESPLPYVE